MFPVAQHALGTEGVVAIGVHRKRERRETDRAAFRLYTVSNTPSLPSLSVPQLQPGGQHTISLLWVYTSPAYIATRVIVVIVELVILVPGSSSQHVSSHENCKRRQNATNENHLVPEALHPIRHLSNLGACA